MRRISSSHGTQVYSSAFSRKVSTSAAMFSVKASADELMYCVATVVAQMATITAIHRPPLLQPDGATCQAFAYIRFRAREKLVALISTINRLITPNVVDCWVSGGSDWSRTARVLSDRCSVLATSSPTLELPLPTKAAQVISSGKMLTNAWAASVMARSNGSMLVKARTNAMAMRSTGRGARATLASDRFLRGCDPLHQGRLRSTSVPGRARRGRRRRPCGLVPHRDRSTSGAAGRQRHLNCQEASRLDRP